MKILLCVTSLPYAQAAVSFGGLIARLTKSPVTLLLTNKPEKLQKDAEKFEAKAKDLLQGVVFTTETRPGVPTKSILEVIDQGDYDMVVLQARKAIRLRKRLGLKVGRVIAQKSPISTLIVKGSRSELKRILICTGGKTIAEKVISTAADIAKAAEAQVTLLHVTNPVPTMYTGLDEIEETLEELLQTDTPTAQHLRHGAAILKDQDLTAQLEVRHGDVAEEILAEAESGDFDLIVIGSTLGENRITKWLLGDVTRQIVNHAKIPILVVR